MDAHQMICEQLAKVCHQANKAYCEVIGDKSQVNWEEAPEWQRQSAISGVRFHLKEDRQPSDSHENWMKEKLADGWVFGEVKDAVKKTHPCIVAYEKLSPLQQNKDILFLNIVKAFKGQVA